MESLIIMLLVFFVIRAVSSKGKQQKPASAPRQAPLQTQPVPPVQSEPKQMMMDPPPASFAAAASSEQVNVLHPMQPTGHNHMAEGSMGDHSTEGEESVGHQHSLHTPTNVPLCMTEDADRESDYPAAAPLLTFQGNDIVRSFVMSEVLKRPCERRH